MSCMMLPLEYGYEDIRKECEGLSKQYKDFIKKVSIGKSWDNREISMLILGSGKRCVLMTGGVHGRESVNPVVLLKLAEEYAKKRRFDEWFQKNQLLIIPLLNPDGYEIARSGFLALKNPRLRLRCEGAAKKEGLSFKEWKYNGRAIDINRNFPCKSWVRGYIGDIPASERETKALIGVFHRYRPRLYLDYHSRERSIYYYRAAREKEYNERQKILAQKLSRLTGYRMKEPKLEIEAGDRGGNTVHYASEYGDCPAFTVETISEKESFPLRTELQKEVLMEIRMTPFI